MTTDLALTIATPYIAVGVPALLIVAAVVLLRGETRPARVSIQDDRTWREEMLRAVAAARLSEQLREARREIDRRRDEERLARQPRRTDVATAYPIGRPPVTTARPA